MAEVILKFGVSMNSSLQPGDAIYYCPTTALASDNIQPDSSTIMKFGTAKIVGAEQVQVLTPQNVDIPELGSYVFFSKDSRINTNSIKGYYAAVEFKNNSTEAAELFSFGIGTDISSK
tara:strand:- start:595 stop:948 length:354 start_codon:yes stop_codon:yes gene_type:complete